MKVLLLITGLGMGGAEKVVCALADALAGRGHEVCVAFMTGAAVVSPVNSSVKLIDLNVKSRSSVVGAFFKLRQFIDEFKPDVVHSHMIHANILARLMRLAIPIKRLISTAHSSNEGGKLRMLAYRLTNCLADVSTNVSKEAVAAFIQAKAVKPGQMLALHNGIATDTFSFDLMARKRLRKELLMDRDESLQIILAVGRLYEAKDYPNLFYAFSKLLKSGSVDLNCRLCIAGDGPLRNDLDFLAIQLGIEDRIRFLGVRHDVVNLMSAADIFVLPSAWEGFGLVVAEAMACERVVVATDCGGVQEVLGNTGYLVRPGNSAALAKALQDALNLTGAERAIVGHAARQRVIENYALNTVVDKWLKVYSDEV